MRIGIIGGGYLGLTAAHELLKKGHEVSLFEAAPALGGQAGTVDVGGAQLERFYHHLFTSDVDIISLMEELGIGDALEWRESKVGFYHGGSVYPFVTPTDLLRFRPLSPLNRVRLGLVTLYLQRFKDWRKLEQITAEKWIRRWAGRQVYDIVWGAQLRGKFGDLYDQVSMVWFWGKIFVRLSSRGQGLQKERLGYPRGSFKTVTDALEQAIRRRGGEILVGAPVQRLLLEPSAQAGRAWQATGLETPTGPRQFDRVLVTAPSYAFAKLVPELPAEYRALLESMPYQAAAVLILRLNRSLSPIYWLNISAPEMPFVGVIEHTNFVPPSEYGGSHLVYVSNYLSAEHELFKLPAEELLERYTPHLRRINPGFDRSWVEDLWLMRERAAQPVIGTNYSSRIPGHETPVENLYLANTTQIYPEDRGTNYSVRLGRVVADLISP